MPSFYSPYDQYSLEKHAAVHVIDWAKCDGSLNLSFLGQSDGFVAAIGNFDGVHKGHEKVISSAVNLANKTGMTPAVVTFNPHPRRFFNPEAEGFFLADQEDQLVFLARLGVKAVIRLSFNEALRTTSAEEFVTEVLADLNIQHLFAGSDFAFGKGRGGSMEMIAALGAEQGLIAHAIDLEHASKQDDHVISSSRIRAAIKDGHVKEAGRLLGRPYIISGEVIEGDQRGRTIGFPTANMRLGLMQQPAFGVYTIAARLADQDGKIYGGVANIGKRPTANDRGVLLEANLFDYDGDLYGQRLNVFLLDHIRPERAFESFDELKAQIAQDAETARQFHRDGTRNL